MSWLKDWWELWKLNRMLKKSLKQGGIMFDFLKQFRMFLSGKKTFLVCISAIITAITAYANGAIDLQTLIKIIFESLAGITIRAGIAKN